MLKDSLIKQRANEISEIANQLGGKPYRKHTTRADRYLQSIEKLIPEDKKKRYSRLMDEFLVANDMANMEIERITYTQGLIDGVELSKILLPGLHQ